MKTTPKADATGGRGYPPAGGVPPSSIRRDVLHGLRQRQKALPSKLFL